MQQTNVQSPSVVVGKTSSIRELFGTQDNYSHWKQTIAVELAPVVNSPCRKNCLRNKWSANFFTIPSNFLSILEFDKNSLEVLCKLCIAHLFGSLQPQRNIPHKIKLLHYWFVAEKPHYVKAALLNVLSCSIAQSTLRFQPMLGSYAVWQTRTRSDIR